MDPGPAKPLDTATRLAVERTRLAHERTLMAWVRTATSLISFGFTIYKFFEFESAQSAVAAASRRGLTPRRFGTIMIAIGIISLALATLEHRRNLARLREFGTAGRSVSMVVAAIVSGLGLLALAAALLRR